ncbi:MAG: hypothetical protein KC589_10905, partial [Nanoarchaeota archaeon]|nr:hypothetical protein [Nanoarchaeota archaeon]
MKKEKSFENFSKFFGYGYLLLFVIIILFLGVFLFLLDPQIFLLAHYRSFYELIVFIILCFYFLATIGLVITFLFTLLLIPLSLELLSINNNSIIKKWIKDLLAVIHYWGREHLKLFLLPFCLLTLFGLIYLSVIPNLYLKDVTFSNI